MSYTDDVERPFSWAVTRRMVHKAIKGRRFNGFDCRTWGLRLNRYPNRPKRPLWLMRVRNSFAHGTTSSR